MNEIRRAASKLSCGALQVNQSAYVSEGCIHPVDKKSDTHRRGDSAKM
jgi:hypothetical protein